jgi:hypothetical protein
MESLPVTGTYTILVDPRGSHGGSMTLTLSQDLLGTLTVMGPGVPVALTRPGQRGRLTFGGTAGQRLSLRSTGGPGAMTIFAVFDTTGSPLAVTSQHSGDATLDLPPLPATGTYTVIADPHDAATATMTLSLAEEIAAPIAVGGASLPLAFAQPGQRARVTFQGTAGQRLSLGVTGSTISTAHVSALGPDGTTLITPTAVGTLPAAVDLPALPSSGAYAILADPQSGLTGNLTLTLSEEVTRTIAPGGVAVTVSIPRPGQRARLTWSGTAGHRVSLKATAISISQGAATLVNPDGGANGQFFSFLAGQAAFGEPRTTPTTGSYALMIDPIQAFTGGVTLALYTVPPDVTGTLAINGTARLVDLAAPGQNASFTFPGTAGRAVTVRGAKATIGCTTLTLVHANGSTSAQGFCGKSWAMAVTLATTGTHTIKVDPHSANVGRVKLRVTAP